MIKLSRPLVVFDIETTGLNVCNDKIISLATIKIFPDGNMEQKSVMFNPGIAIPSETTAIHGITDEMVKDKHPFASHAKALFAYLAGCDLAVFNGNMLDMPMMIEHFLKLDLNFPDTDVKVIDAGIIFKRREERTLSAALKFYCEKDHTDAHSSMADAFATLDVLKKQFERYADLSVMSIDQLALYSNYDKPVIDYKGVIGIDSDGDYVYMIGNNRGKEKIKHNLEFVDWICARDFPLDTKRKLREIQEEILNQPSQDLFE
ncbi:DnaQ DNA polymerase III, epsilon subunit and related 3'-5' exonucleases [uncultured Caudovirales phage]|uniref:DnaQ DNA polymerase III, epsilon subunit and related 3'-5' exonucleases n=1 Tax=uncultured Caudovirales phage TaxID=2100421 RepID=A0A6J5ST12_9CAUD|nr:DnaQ DNA polymerase III, epsilon subunit and related 3'-5' exonucleases [uncultured Caudovirales phage]